MQDISLRLVSVAAVVTPDLMLHAFAQMLAQHQQQTADILNWLQQQFQDMSRSAQGEGKGSLSSKGRKGAPISILFKRDQHMYATLQGHTSCAHEGVWRFAVSTIWFHGPDLKTDHHRGRSGP